MLQRLRLVVATLSVAVMVAVLGLSLGVYSGSAARIAELRSAVGEHTYLVQLDTSGVQGSFTLPPPLDREPQRLLALRSAPGVEVVSLFGSSSKLIGGAAYSAQPVDADFFAARALEVVQGRPFAAPGEAVVGAGLADTLGQSVSTGLSRVTVVGVLAPVGARGDIDRNTDQTVFANADGFFGLTQTDQMLVVAQPERYREVGELLRAWVAPLATAGGVRYTVEPLADQYGVTLRRRAADLLGGALGFGVVAATLAALLNLLAFFLARALDNLRALGVRRALGATRRQVVWEDTLAALRWTAPGLVLGVLSTALLNRWAAQSLALPVSLSAGAWALLLAAATGVILFAALLPSLWASRQTPVLALRGVAARLPGWQVLLTAAGLTLGTAGLVVQSSSAAAAEAETARILGRTDSGVFRISPSYIDGETFTDPRGQLRLSEFMIEDLMALPEWGNVERAVIRERGRAELAVGDVRQPLTLVQAGAFEDNAALGRLELLSGRWPGAGEVALGERAAATLRPDAGADGLVGQTLPLNAGGTLRVSGVFGGPERSGAEALAVRGSLPGSGLLALHVESRVPGTGEALAGFLNREYGGPELQPVRPLYPLEFAPEVRRTLLELGRVYGLLSATLLLLGGAGLATQLLLALARRTREVGLRRALGATRRDIFGQFLGESLRLGLLASLAGLALGLVATVPLLRAQAVAFAVSPPALALAVMVGMGIALVFGALPALLAARISPAGAMRQE